ncbi:hypothetical protein GCM10008090_32630 [Arenicella chitinivorans]|uniref:PspA/IM30 family protein n=1 Tax=Arenicella chitinivorans TaxID=1329800 RepID=A0A918VQT8_9GAMM|nr:PspA/IM30 family protein [Arenicella chitinivorans]GHA20183.1 hypothetical protein GCM10008090_32630 [Arenicella chitinivorans]
MKLIKRLSTTLSATLDSAVGQLENHDAIVEATIKQTRQSVAKTKARINTLKQQLNAYEQQLTDAREQYQLWTDRAAKLAESDQSKALRCVARRNQYEAEVGRLNHAALQQRDLIRDVSHNLEKLQDRLEEMTHKHTLMRSRQTVADVNRAVASIDRDESINDTFERWESMVLEHEFAVSDACARDPLDLELTRIEDEADLLAQLKLIQAEHTPQQEQSHE